MKYGRFTNMPREEVAAHLESRGFAVYDHESDDDLREAAYLDEENDEDEARADYEADLEEQAAEEEFWDPKTGETRTFDARAVLAELDRIDAVYDAVDDLRQLLREAKRQDPGWFERELKRRRKAAHAAESVNHEPPIVNRNVK